MRKVEKDMLAAIKDGRNWQSGNTQVTCGGALGIRSDVFLHGNKIAETYASVAFADENTFRQYPTRTTVSRLRALGINACVRKGVPMIDGEPV